MVLQEFFLDIYYWLLQIYLLTLSKSTIPIREIKMVSSRFSGKSHVMERLIALYCIQTKIRVVINYIRARGEDVYKAMDNMESLIYSLTKKQVKITQNQVKRTLKVGSNKINFTVLNEIKEKVSKTGGKIGVPIEYEADFILTFYEETSQLNRDLVENHKHSVRGNENTQYLFVYASNPWVKTHWLMEDFARHLPEDHHSERELEDQGYNSYFDPYFKTLYFRPRYTRNTFLKTEQVKDIEKLKNINFSKWRIVSLGFSGTLTGSIYQASLKKLNEDVDYVSDLPLYGGIDWGDGKSELASPSTAYIMGINPDEGIHIYAEYEYWNNRGMVLSTDEQLERLCDFYIYWYHEKGRPITVYIDNAAMGDFFNMVQSVLRRKGYEAHQIEFLPAIKRKNTWERVEVVNVLLALGILRFERTVCPGLYRALDNCYEVVKTNPTEEMKRQRSHEWTHWIHALEYAIGEFFMDFQMRFPIFIENKTNYY